MPNTIFSGVFVPTTNVWDVSQIYDIDITSPQFKELLVRLYQNLNNISTALNLKDSGYYITQSFVNSQLFFPNPDFNSSTAVNPGYRQVFRLVVDFGALPNTGTKSVPHNIPVNSGYTFTRIYATSSDTTGFNYIPIPYASASGTDNIELSVNATDVTITTAGNRSNFGVTYVIVEYIAN
jgi:aryl-phospho-beta-D-glucosidase BglC (GH1 family)